MSLAIALALAAAAMPPSTPDLGKREGACRPNEPGPALLIDVVGLKDRSGLLRAELYPAVDGDFLADDNVLIAAGKTFARVDMAVPHSGPVRLCIRVPRTGRYALSLLHDRNANLKFDLSDDGIGFPGNPTLGWSKPRADKAAFQAGPGLTTIEIRLNYRRGLAMRPLEDR
ncbi:DUF2141 domain-containing protein [Sphingomonas sp. YL-JM2C]